MSAAVLTSRITGLVREIISLVALICGFILAVLYYQVPAAWMVRHTKTETIANLLGFLLIFLGCITFGITVAFLINRLIKAASLKWIDRILGGIFGFLRGWAICSVLALALIAFPVRENIMARSFLAPFVMFGAQMAASWVPRNLKDLFNDQYKKVIQAWNENRKEI